MFITRTMLGASIPSLALAALTVASNFSSFQDRCLSFRPELHVYNSARTELAFVSAGTNLTFPDNDPTCNRESQLVSTDTCRVAMSIPTSNRSSITYEMWLPESWTGRMLATGNGGIDGCVKYEDIAYGAANGFSSIGTNNGHNGTVGDAFYLNDDVVVDYAWRALHTSVEVGKKLTNLFYGESVQKSYFLGCSLGGRQGINSADLFPEDFDGIVAGSPAVDFNSLYSWRASFITTTGSANSENFISADTWKTTIHEEVLRQCDEIDGVIDGIIEDPTLCHFQPEMLLCRSENESAQKCLSESQVHEISAIFSDYLWPNGSFLYPGMQPGSEVQAADGLYAGKAYQPSVDWFKFAILQDPSWDPVTYTLEDALVATQKNPGGIRTWPSSLDAFASHGGKILTFHGQQDQQITSYNSIRFYDYLASGTAYNSEQMDKFYRLFRIPGMNHCSGGRGAWVIGQGGNAASTGIPFDETHNVLAALIDWVENGEAPDTIVGTKFVDDDVREGVEYNHRHCRYPLRSTYKGAGHESLDIDSWECL
ncbi:feruloyl esterase B [Xylariaceae sp. FL0662B]|nr:feruloyl esterase B [Xylariaceae sp. FL0662B]